MNYNLINEDENKFTFDKDGEEVHIAKYGLDGEFMERLRGMQKPQEYADGGIVDLPNLISQDAANFSVTNPMGGVLTVPKDFSDPDTMELYNRAAAQAERGARPSLSSPVQESASLAQPAVISTPAAPPSPIMPATVGTPAMPSYLSMMEGLAQKKPTPTLEMPSDMAQAFEGMKQASIMDAQAKAESSAAQQQAMAESVQDLKLEQLRFDTQMRKLDAERENLIKDYSSGKIDANRVYNNMTTGNRVLAGISVLLGGLSQGLTGAKSNPAMDVINNAIDRDIDSQKADLGKKQNLLSLNLQKYGNLKDATQATKMQIMTIAQAQVNEAAAKSGSKQALAASQMFNADLDLKMSTIKSQLAASEAMSEKMNQPGGVPYKDVMKMNQDLQDKMVQLPNGNYLPAFNKESAGKVRDIQSEIYRVKDTLNQAKQFMDQGASLPLTDRNKLAKTINQRVLGELKSKAMLDLGALTESDLALLEPMVPSVGDFFSAGSKQKLEQLNQMLDSKMNAHYSAFVPGLNPSGRASREQPVFRRP